MLKDHDVKTQRLLTRSLHRRHSSGLASKLKLLQSTAGCPELAPMEEGVYLLERGSVGIYLAIFACYWLYNLVHMVMDLKGAARIRQFTTHKLGLSERQLQSVTWPEVAHRIVLVRLPISGFAERSRMDAANTLFLSHGLLWLIHSPSQS